MDDSSPVLRGTSSASYTLVRQSYPDTPLVSLNVEWIHGLVTLERFSSPVVLWKAKFLAVWY